MKRSLNFVPALLFCLLGTAYGQQCDDVATVTYTDEIAYQESWCTYATCPEKPAPVLSRHLSVYYWDGVSNPYAPRPDGEPFMAAPISTVPPDDQYILEATGDVGYFNLYAECDPDKKIYYECPPLATEPVSGPGWASDTLFDAAAVEGSPTTCLRSVWNGGNPIVPVPRLIITSVACERTSEHTHAFYRSCAQDPVVPCGNGVCETGELGYCPEDCRCGDSICDYDEDYATCPVDCENPVNACIEDQYACMLMCYVYGGWPLEACAWYCCED